jgi:hypothetical protein
MPNLRSQLERLAATFTDGVLDVIRDTSLDELLRESGSGVRAARTEGPNRRSPKPAFASSRASSRASTSTSSGRLHRRSADEIAAELDRIVGLLAKHRDGLRAEQIRAELGLHAKELPRVLKQGLTSKKLRAKGQKRATTYFAR